jgi:hypothetical protein
MFKSNVLRIIRELLVSNRNSADLLEYSKFGIGQTDKLCKRSFGVHMPFAQFFVGNIRRT